MRQFVLNDAEIQHILELRSLPNGQRDALVSATHALSLTTPHLALVKIAPVIDLLPRRA